MGSVRAIRVRVVHCLTASALVRAELGQLA